MIRLSRSTVSIIRFRFSSRCFTARLYRFMVIPKAMVESRGAVFSDSARSHREFMREFEVKVNDIEVIGE